MTEVVRAEARLPRGGSGLVTPVAAWDNVNMPDDAKTEGREGERSPPEDQIKEPAKRLDEESAPEAAAPPDQEGKTPGERLKTFLRDTAFLLPSAVKLVRGLLKDSRVPLRWKVVTFLFLLYLINPVDLIPDWFLGIGHIDDWLLALVLLDGVLGAVPEEVVRQHWDHAWDIVGLARQVRPLMPTSVARQLFSWSAEAWRWGARQVMARVRRTSPRHAAPPDDDPRPPE